MTNVGQLSRATMCGHCQNTAPMQIVGTYSGVKSYDDHPHSGLIWDAGPVWELLLCPVCEDINLREHYWHSESDPADETTYRNLYPFKITRPEGLPVRVAKAFDAAQNVRSKDANAYAGMLGRLLDVVCDDKGATKGQKLHARLLELNKKGIIPPEVASVALGLKDLRNVGGHADAGELTAEEVPVLDKLTSSILDFLYTAPSLAKQAQELCQKRRGEQRVS